MVKNHITHEGLDILEKRLAPGTHLAQQRVLGIAPFQHRMEQKGQEVETEQKRREIGLAMTTVVLQMIALGLEDVVVVVVDLPPPTPRVGNVHYVVSRQAMSRDTAMVIQLFARFGLDDGKVEPMDGPSIVTAAQAYVVDGAYPRHFREAPIAVASFMRGHGVGGLPKRSALIEFGMGVGCTRKDEGAPML